MNTISPQQFQSDEETLIVDVRTRDEYQREHIAGSINLPLDDLENQASLLKGRKKIVLTCQSGKRAGIAYGKLQQRSGETGEVILLENGLNGWKAAGNQTRSFKSGISIMRQVQIVAGSMVLAGFFFQPVWFLVPLVGIGFLVAGMTNTCMMASLLSIMPWNRTDNGKIATNCALPS